MMKITIAETAQKHGVKSAYALQKALNISPTIAARLWKGDFDKIGIKTLERLCDYFHCQPNDFLVYPLTLSSNTELRNNETLNTQLSNTELRINTQLSNTDTQSSNTQTASDNENEYNMTVKDVVALLESSGLSLKPRTIREKAEKGELHGKQGKQNHWFFRQVDVSKYWATRGKE